jgi:hypothetical protein
MKIKKSKIFPSPLINSGFRYTFLFHAGSRNHQILQNLMSTYEGEHTIFGFLSQANLTQNDVLQFHPFTSE